MDNPIQYSDLISESVNEGLNKLIDQFKKLQSDAENAMVDIKKKAEEAGVALKNTTPSTEDIKKVEDLYTAYKTLGFDVTEYKAAVEAVSKAEKDRNKVIDIAKALDESRSDTYNALSAQYRALKILINELTAEERTNTEVGKQLVARSKEIYEQMNKMQAATGKYTLNVGNYTSAVNGLQLSFNQITRELPSLTNSMSQFAIAISNNIPIFTDQIKIYGQAHEEAKRQLAEFVSQGMTTEAAIKAMGEQAKFLTGTFKALVGTFKTLAGWIGIISAIIPAVVKIIEKKRKAMKELKGATDEVITSMGVLNASMKKELDAVDSATGKIKIYLSIYSDLNRSEKERASALTLIKGLMKENALEYGKSATSIQDYIDMLDKQAQAEAKINRILELKKSIRDEEAKEKEIKQTSEYQKALDKYAKAYARYQSKQRDYIIGLAPSEAVENAKKAVEKAQANIDAFTATSASNIKIWGEEIARLEKEINLTDALGLGTSGEKGKKANDYYWEFLRARYTLTKDERIREKKLAQVEYDEQIERYKKILAEEKVNAQQREYIEGIIVSLHEQRRLAMIEIDRKYDAEENKQKKKKQKTEEDFFKEEIDALNLQLHTWDQNTLADNKNKIRRRKELLDNEYLYWEEYRGILEKYGKLTVAEEDNINANLDRIRTEKKKAKPRNFWELLGFAVDEDFSKDFTKAIDQAFSTAFSYANQWIDYIHQIAEEAVKAAEKEAESAKTALDYEMEARANGYANNVELARKEYEEKLALQQRAQEESDRIAKIQAAIDTSQQISSLLVATANILAAYTKGTVLGLPLAVAAISAMWGTFAAAKITATKLTTYGDGMSEYLDYGGSHASGHDIDFGTARDGSRRRVERGEMIGVINKKNVRKYGVGEISSIIDSLNKGTFEEKYGSAFGGLAVGGSDLSSLESGVNELVEQGNRKVVVAGGTMIEYYKNTKRIIRNS